MSLEVVNRKPVLNYATTVCTDFGGFREFGERHYK